MACSASSITRHLLALANPPFGAFRCRMQDNLAMSAIQFLTTVNRSVKASLFQNADTMQQVGRHTHLVCPSWDCAEIA